MNVPLGGDVVDGDESEYMQDEMKRDGSVVHVMSEEDSDSEFFDCQSDVGEDVEKEGEDGEGMCIDEKEVEVVDGDKEVVDGEKVQGVSEGENVPEKVKNEVDMLHTFTIKNLDTNEVKSLLEFTKEEHPFVTFLDFKENRQKKQKRNVSSNFFNLFTSKEEETGPPNRIRVFSHKKKMKHFSDLRRIQVFEKAHEDSIWCIEQSRDGGMLATGGRDGKISIWKVELEGTKDNNRKVLGTEPYRIYHPSNADVVALDWSATGFLVAVSMDKSIRIYLPHQYEYCLYEFVEEELITGVKYHPTDPSLFITCSFDEKIRVYDLNLKEVRFIIDTKSMITSIAWGEQGKLILAGTFDGKCKIYSMSNQLHHKTTIEVRSKRGKNKGKRISGIFVTSDQKKVLISTHDSRHRLYSLSNFSELCKYKGHINQNSQIKGSFDHNNKFIISGSENKGIYIWSVGNEGTTSSKRMKGRKDLVNSFEGFTDGDSGIMNAIFLKTPQTVKSKGPYTDMSNVVIVTTDLKGNVKVYENYC